MKGLAFSIAFSLAVALAGAACGPSDVCVRYVACQKAYDATVDTSAYDNGGSCWGALQTAEACSAQCKQALDALAEVPNPPPACAPSKTK